MRKVNIVILIVALVLAVCFTAVRTVTTRDIPIDQVAGIQHIGKQGTLVATYESNQIVLRVADAKGNVNQSHSISRKRDGNIVSLADMGVDEEGIIYLLKDIISSDNGQLIEQELELYDMSRLIGKRRSRVTLPLKDGLTYRWISAGSSVVLLGTNEVTPAPKNAGIKPTKIIREAYEPASLYQKELPASKGRREYDISAKQSEGVYEVVLAGTDIVYSSKAGRVYSITDAEGAKPTEIFPLTLTDTLKYALYLSPINRETTFVGVQGDEGYLTAIRLADGAVSRQNDFMRTSSYTAADIRAISMVGMSDFSAIVHKSDSPLALTVAIGGDISDIYQLRQSPLRFVLTTILTFAISLIVLLLIGRLVSQLILVATEGNTILMKLVITSVPLILVALVFFGVFSYRTYASSINRSFQKQVTDEGAMLTALFGTDTLFGTDDRDITAATKEEEIYRGLEYPYDYGENSYEYIQDQMRKREIYTALSFYENGKLSLAVEKNAPCFYPFDIRLDTHAEEMYVAAALTGATQVGEINDSAGRRIVSITPIGGTAGSTVCLLETGVYYAQLESYTFSFLRTYLIVAAVFIVLIAGALTLLFMRVLMPINELKKGMENFNETEQPKKLDIKATAEFKEIIRVFNEMADNITRQIVTLRKEKEAYFKFVPSTMLELLGLENLGAIELGKGIEKEAYVLCVNMDINSAGLTTAQEQELTNRFFSIVNLAANQHGGTVITDAVNLRRLRIICPDDGDSAVDMAVSALAVIDSANAGLPVQSQMKVMMVLHKTHIFYGICGDRERMIPTILSDDLDAIAQNKENLREISRRLLVTQSAIADITDDRYYSRFIGYMGSMTDSHFALHDLYDVCPTEEIRLINDTRITFDKAMELLKEERWYDAKNFFTLVLRQNQRDNVARHYVFICEKNLQGALIAQ